MKTLHLGCVAARFHRLRTRLHNVYFAAISILGPFDVHRPAVVLFNHQGLLGQLVDVGVADAEFFAVGLGRFLAAHALAGFVGIHHALLLGAALAAQDRVLAGAQCGFVDVELIGIDCALHDHFAEAITGGHENRVTESGFGVESEQHAGRTDIRAHHQLHAGGQEYVLVREAVMPAIRTCAIFGQRGEHFLGLLGGVGRTGSLEAGFLVCG